MKRLISILLCAAVINAFQPEPRAQVAPCIFVLAMATAAMTITIYVMKKSQPAATHTFVLQTRDQHNNWVNLATNTLRMPPEVFYQAFWTWKQTNHVVHLYRVVEIPWPYENRPLPTTNWVNRPVYFTELTAD